MLKRNDESRVEISRGRSDATITVIGNIFTATLKETLTPTCPFLIGYLLSVQNASALLAIFKTHGI